MGPPFPEHWSLAHRLHLPSCWVNIRIHLPYPLEVVFLFFLFLVRRCPRLRSLSVQWNDQQVGRAEVSANVSNASRPEGDVPGLGKGRAGGEENRERGLCSSQCSTLAAPKKQTPRAWGCHPRSWASSPGPGLRCRRSARTGVSELGAEQTPQLRGKPGAYRLSHL